jgi:pyruvate dehydrogenase E1 component beta subunit
MTRPIELRLEQYSEEMEYGTIARWRKREGEAVVAGEIVVEVETDKATQEVEAPVSGVLDSILAVEGDEIKVGDPMAVIIEED